MIPCIEDKCLKYPVCKHKKTITCDDLMKYYKLIRMKENSSLSCWRILNEHLPNLKGMSGLKDLPRWKPTIMKSVKTLLEEQANDSMQTTQVS